MGSTDDAAFQVIKRVMARQDPSIWPLGTWLEREETPSDHAALASLPPRMGYPEGGQIALLLAGWDDRSTWGFDPPDDAYFAQLWRNGSPNENPDIWVFGHGTLDGREFVLASTRTLAQEIAAATGHDLSAVCAAMINGHHDDADDPGDDNEPPEQPGPPISLKDELGKQGWF
jgi:hypothetical protein